MEEVQKFFHRFADAASMWHYKPRLRDGNRLTALTADRWSGVYPMSTLKGMTCLGANPFLIESLDGDTIETHGE